MTLGWESGVFVQVLFYRYISQGTASLGNLFGIAYLGRNIFPYLTLELLEQPAGKKVLYWELGKQDSTAGDGQF